MLSHDRIWSAIDALAARHGFSPSGLARRAGLDPTSFNKSKRFAADGRARWPSTESVSKVLEATSTSLEAFTALVSPPPEGAKAARRTVPLLGSAQAGSHGYFDDAGFPAGQGWDEIELPPGTDEAVYALEVSGQSMMPLYREGDYLIVSPGQEARRGDRVVVRTRSGEVMAKTLQRRTARTVELSSFNPDYPDRQFAVDEIEWMARILWVSQ